jgi:hypothetical protein
MKSGRKQLRILIADRPVPAELGSDRVTKLPGKLKGERYKGLPALSSKMDHIQSKVESCLTAQHESNEQVSKLRVGYLAVTTRRAPP